MTAPKRPGKKKAAAYVFPLDVCAGCKFYEAPDKESGICWAEPGKPLIDSEGMIVWDRGAYAEPDHPACIHFTPRLHA